MISLHDSGGRSPFISPVPMRRPYEGLPAATTQFWTLGSSNAGSWGGPTKRPERCGVSQPARRASSSRSSTVIRRRSVLIQPRSRIVRSALATPARLGCVVQRTRMGDARAPARDWDERGDGASRRSDCTRPAHAQSICGRRIDRADRARVRAARLPGAPPGPGALARADPQRGVGLRLRPGDEGRWRSTSATCAASSATSTSRQSAAPDIASWCRHERTLTPASCRARTNKAAWMA